MPFIAQQGKYNCNRTIQALMWLSMFCVVFFFEIGRKELAERKNIKRLKDKARGTNINVPFYELLLTKQAELERKEEELASKEEELERKEEELASTVAELASLKASNHHSITTAFANLKISYDTLSELTE